jgi:tetratricopeptide (TPR) repeat protein
VSFDRIATLRNAVKLLRLGKLMPAIEEYVRVVDDDPRDWATANTLGDLYVRARQIDKGVAQFMRIADALSEEGDFAKAGALYKKILKLKPDDEHALLQAAEIAAAQGLIGDARGHLNAVIERRKARNDVKGTAQIRVRLGSLDPGDFDTRIAAAGARVELGDAAGAVRDLKQIAGELIDKGRPEQAIGALREAASLNPADDGIRAQLLNIYISTGDFARARESASTVEQFTTLAGALESHGAAAEALDTLRQAARLPAAGAPLKARVARAYAERGDLASAGEFLNEETAGADVPLQLALAEIRLLSDRWDEGVGLLKKILRAEPARQDDIATIAGKTAERNPDAAFGVIELLVDPAVKRREWMAAAGRLQDFVAKAPTYLPALMRLIEVCVDGGLEAPMYAAQAQLADAYIAAGAGIEARFIAEDLVAREPWEQGHIDRFRRALILLGEPDPDKVIADRLSGESPFTSIDRVLASDDLFEPVRLDMPEPPLPEPEPPPPPVVEAPVVKAAKPAAAEALAKPPVPADAPVAAVSPAAIAAPPAPVAPAAQTIAPPPPVAPAAEPEPAAPEPKATQKAERDPFALAPNAIDLSKLLDDDDEVEIETDTDSAEDSAGDADDDDVEVVIETADDEEDDEEDVEVDDADDEADGEAEGEEVTVNLEAEDLSIVLEEVDLSSLLDEITATSSAEAKQGYGLTAGDLVDLDGAEAFFRRGVALEESGDVDGCVAAFEAAAKAPAWQFAAAARLGRLFRKKGQVSKAIEWFERASLSGAPSPIEASELLYDLADTLESAGDSAKALAVSLRLQTSAGQYRDIAARIDRLTKVQARG